MDWQVIVALVIIIPVILIPVLFVWYLNIGGVYAAIKAAWQRRAVGERGGKQTAEAEQHIVVER
jgi:hypothetical protein